MRGRTLPRAASLTLAAIMLASFIRADGADVSSLVLVSRSSSGATGNDDSSGTSMSRKGRFIAFASLAGNLVEDDTNGMADVFVHDRRTGVTRRVSVASDGRQARQMAPLPISVTAMAPVISTDGDVVAFWSRGTDLDPDGRAGIFVHELATGKTTHLIDVVGATTTLSLSYGGRFVAFDTAAPLIGPDTNGVPDVYMYDREFDMVRPISLGNDGLPMGGVDASLAADAPLVAFQSPGIPSAIYVHDMWNAVTQRASLSWRNEPADAASAEPWISADGRRVAFRSAATNLVPGDHNEAEDVFVRDLVEGTTVPVSLANDGRSANGASSAPRLSDDGNRVLFASRASNLVAGDTNNAMDVFVRDLLAVATERVSLSVGGLQLQRVTGDDHALSGDATTFAFASADDAVTSDDGDIFVDIFAAGPALPPGVPSILSPVDGDTIETASVIVEGAGDRGDTIVVSTDGTTAGETTVGDDGSWSLPLTLSAGVHELSATAGNGSMTSEPSPVLSITVRLDPPPAPTIRQPVEGSLLGAAPAVVAGIAQPGTTVTILEGGMSLRTAIADENGSWRTTITFTEGSHSISASAMNANGTGPASPARTFSVDATPPSQPLIVTPGVAEVLSTRTVSFSGSAEPGARLDLSGLPLAAPQPTAGPDGSWQTAVDLPAGSYSVTAAAIDGAGNRSLASAPRSFRVDLDTTGPQLTVATKDLSLLLGDAGLIEGTATDDRAVAQIVVRFYDLRGSRLTVRLALCEGCDTTSATWSLAPDLTPGAYEARIQAFDRAGNPSRTVSLRFVRA